MFAKILLSISFTFALAFQLLANDEYYINKKDGLILHYDFNGGQSTVVKDKSGNKLNGYIIGAKYVKNNKGYALKFDGKSCVQVAESKLINSLGKPGQSYSIAFRFKSQGGHNHLSFTEKWPKSTSSFPWAIRGPYPDGKINFIIYSAPGRRLARASYTHPATRDGKWHHLVAIRDVESRKVKIYIDGVPGRESSDIRLKGKDISNNGPVIIGARNYSKKISYGFIGQIDDFRIYNKALSKAEVNDLYGLDELPKHRDIESADTIVKFSPIVPCVTQKKGNLTVKTGNNGGMQLDIGKDSFIIKSCFSYPGKDNKIGWNGFPGKFDQPRFPAVEFQKSQETKWTPKVKQISNNVVTVTGEGKFYRIKRKITLHENQIDFEDEFTNLRKVPTGIAVRYGITSNTDFLERFNVGLEVAANPIVFMQGPNRSIAMVMKDKISRDRIRASLGSSRNHSGLQVERFVVGTNKTYTFSWSIYIMKEGQKYFDFINRLRRDWNANFTIDGPFTFAYLKPEGDDIKFYLMYSSKYFYINKVLADPQKMQEMREYFKWRGTKIVTVAPWLDFEPGAMDHMPDWNEYRKIMGKFLPAMRKIAPQIRILAGIETDIVSFDRKKIKLGARIPIGDRSKKRGKSIVVAIKPDVSKSIVEGYPEWKDSFVRDSRGQFSTYSYYRGGKAIEKAAIHVYPAVGNKRYNYYMEQLKLALVELDMDGVYCDDFVLGQTGSKRVYGGKGDGFSGRIDFYTGKASGLYKDCSIAGVQARVNIMKYALSKNKIIVCNRHSTNNLAQSIPAFRFTETHWDIPAVIRKWKPGTKPAAINYMFFAHLNSPLGLGVGNLPAGVNEIKWMMKGIIVYLRHGMVYYHYHFREPAMNEANKHAFDIIKHMFPITPVELGEGFLVGKERILSAISMDCLWEKKTGRPVVTIFDLNGRKVNTKDRFSVKAENGKWRLKLKLKDWAEVAVVQ